MLLGRELEEFQDDMLNNRWLEKANEHTKYIQIFAAERRRTTIQRDLK
jgi:hypothetical protein